MALCLARSTLLRCNLKKSLISKNLNIVKLFHFNSKQPRVSNIVMQQRSHYWVSGIFGKQSELTLKHMDKVPIEYKMIYRNDDVDVHLKWMYVTIFTLAGLIIGMIAFNFEVESPKYIVDEKATPVRNDLLIILFAFTLCFMSFHSCMKRMPVRIYRVPRQGNHVFVFNASIPFTTRKLTCNRGEFMKIDKTYPPFIEAEILYRITDKQNIFLFVDGFKVPADLEILLGQREDYDDDPTNTS